MLRLVLYLPVPVEFERLKCAPCSLQQKTSHLSLTSQVMAFEHSGNYINLYIVYACNVYY